MLQYLINVTHTIFPTLLVVALLSGLIGKVRAASLKKPFFAGTILGAIIAIVLAVLRLNTGFVIRELYNAPLLLLALVAQAWLFVCLLLSGKKGLAATEKLSGRLVFVLGLLWFAYALPDMLLYPFEFDVGMDSIFNLEFLGKVTGYLIALSLACLAALSLFRLVIRCDEKALRRIVMSGLLILGAWHLLLFLQIAVLRNWVPGFGWLVELVMWSLQHQAVFLFAFLAVSVFASIGGMRAGRAQVIDGENPALKRKQKMASKRQVRWALFLLLNVVAVFLILTVGVEVNSRVVELAPPVELAHDAGRIEIPVAQVNDGHLHRFSYTAEDGTRVRYIVIKKSESAFGVGLDACDVCGPSGYYERNGQIVCILCDVVMNISTIGFKGGCNPVPLEYVMEDGRLIIQTADLESEAHRFR
ncbi:DUF2318 domain-containing protein [Oxalobacter sp. OttesenSCG-928-P03]|nr:DUF2318 domain-containing protein [Oxalobacter sp. OttesenSCG-928-P03]